MQKTLPFKGTRDISGDDMRFRIAVLSTIQRVFTLFGFEPLETPIIERSETLLGKYGEEAENLLFMLSKPHDDGGLRYDHTVPLARFAAANWQGLNKPYKRFAIGSVFRAENPQLGRYRQFYQCDFDTLGSSSVTVDAEIAAVNFTVLKELGFSDEFVIYLNDRELLNAMVLEMGFEGKDSSLILRAWDKLDKISVDETCDYLIKQGISQELVDKNYKETTNLLYSLRDKSSKDTIFEIEKHFKSGAVKDSLEKVKTLIDQIDSFGVPEVFYSFNPLLARGLSYYTGPIFETVVKKKGIGSISGGGRYDNLIEQMGGPSVAASGSSFGLDRLLAVMEELGIRPNSSQTTKVFVTIFDTKNPKLCSASFSMASELRRSGISAEVFSGDSGNIGKQIEMAVKKNIPFLIIIGEDELKDNKVTIRNLDNREEVTLNISDVVSFFEKN